MSFKLKPISNCPNCHSNLRTVALGCSQCSLEIRGEFALNSFSQLDEDMLHFLHVFIHCEGKIADMEKALGISYPTVKSKIIKLKEAVQAPVESKIDFKNEELSTLEILAKIEKGEMDYKSGLDLIKNIQGKKK